MKQTSKIISLLFAIMLGSSAFAGIAAATTQEIVTSDYPGILAGFGNRIIKTTYDDGSITWEQQPSIVAKLSLLSLNAYGGRIIYVLYSYSGQCGSGTSNSYSYSIDGVWSYGTMQISCTVPAADRETTLKNRALSYAQITSIDTVYLNNILYQSGDTTTPTPTATAAPTATQPPAPTATQPAPTTTQPPTPGACNNLEFALNGKCVKIIPTTPGFEGILAVLGLAGLAGLRTRKGGS